MDVTNLLNLIGMFTDAGRLIAGALAGLGFVASGLHPLIAHVIGSPRGQEQGKAGMVRQSGPNYEHAYVTCALNRKRSLESRVAGREK